MGQKKNMVRMKSKDYRATEKLELRDKINQENNTNRQQV